MRKTALVTVLLVLAVGLLTAQQTQQPPQAPVQQTPQAQQPAQAPRMPASPPGQAATQVGGKWVEPKAGAAPRYTDGKWITVEYGRPILRGRKNIFGTPARGTAASKKAAPKAAGKIAATTAATPAAAYGEKVNDGAPVWRAGANVTTRLKTQVPLVLGGKTLEAGDYSMFVDLDNGKWTLILSNQPHQLKYDPNNKTETWGSFNYDQKFDLLRVPMTMKTGADTIDQFTIQFVNMTETGGTLQMLWEKTIAQVPFKVGQ
jgi:hypothetical protein